MHRKGSQRLSVVRLAGVSRSALARSSGVRAGTSSGRGLSQFYSMARRPAGSGSASPCWRPEIMKIGLYRFGARHRPFWRGPVGQRGIYIQGARVGSPPDDFSPNGRNGRFPPPDRDAHRENGYALFAQSIRNNATEALCASTTSSLLPPLLDSRRHARHPRRIRPGLRRRSAESRAKAYAGTSTVGRIWAPSPARSANRWPTMGSSATACYGFNATAPATFCGPTSIYAQAVVSTTTHDLPTLRGIRDWTRYRGSPRRPG